MKIYAPDYYNEFCCIADKCRHNCCIGWEIDIDSSAYDYYRTVVGDMGERFARDIHIVDGTPCFRLGDDDRCPFLNSNNLCDIITTLGDDKLCDICTDHPRYRNYYSSRTEIGLGLCCEEAARIILTHQSKTQLMCIDEDDDIAIDEQEEDTFFAFRQKAFDIVQDRTTNITDRLAKLCRDFDISITERSLTEWADILYSLERLDESWNDRLDMLRKDTTLSTAILSLNPISAEQLLVYYLYRHMPDGMYDSRMSERMAFAIVSTCIIFAIASGENKTDTDNLADIARMYSAEIEYSDENIDNILDVICK